MQNEVETLNILRVTEEGASDMEDVVVREFPLTIVLNDQELVTLLCTPSNLKNLAVGFLFSEGFIEGRDEIKSVAVNGKPWPQFDREEELVQLDGLRGKIQVLVEY